MIEQKVLNRSSALFNNELKLFLKRGIRRQNHFNLISDGELPPDVVPTAWCHSLTISSSYHSLPPVNTPTAVHSLTAAATRSCRSESFCGSCGTAQTIRESQHRVHSLSKQQRGVLTAGTVLASAASSPVAGSPVKIPRFVLAGSRSQ